VTASSIRLHRLLGATLGIALAVSGIAVLGANAAAASDSSMFAEVNASRASAGQPAYAWSSDLASVAQAQAERMAKKHLLYHNPNLTSDVGSFRWVGENVGYGPTSGVIENAFMHSTEHRANILDSDYTQIGIGSVLDGNGRLWVAQVFREPIGGGVATPAHRTARTTHRRATTTTHVRTHTTSRVTRSGKAPAGGSTSAGPGTSSASTPTHRAAQPVPTPTLAQRVSSAVARSGPAPGDPLADTLDFAVTMSAVGS